MATGDYLKATKAYAAAVAALLAPGAVFLIANAGGGITGSEWLTAGLMCVAAAGAGGTAAYVVENKPKPGAPAAPVAPDEEDPYPAL